MGLDIQSQSAVSGKACGIRRWHHGRIICHPAIENDSGSISEPTEGQRIGNQIDAAFIFARADFVKMDRIKNSTQLPLYSGGIKIMRIN